VSIAISKFDNLVLDGRAVTSVPVPSMYPGVHRRLAEILLDNLMGLRVGVSDVTCNLVRMRSISQCGEIKRRSHRPAELPDRTYSIVLRQAAAGCRS
jgi:hypothetical protein